MSGNLLLCSRDWINNNFISSRGDVKNLVVHLSEVQNMFQQESIFYQLKEFGEFTVSWSKWRNVLFLIRPNFRLFLATKRSTVIVNENLSLFTVFISRRLIGSRIQHRIRNRSLNYRSSLTFVMTTMTFFSCDRMQRLRASNKRVSFDEIIIASRWWEIKRRRERRGKEFEKKNGIVERIFNNISSFRLGL